MLKGIPAPIATQVVEESRFVSIAWSLWFGLVGTSLSKGGILSETHANRANYPAATYPGSVFYETDRTVFYISTLISSTWTWIYANGTMRGTLSPDLRPTLTTADEGFLFYSTDYAHTFRWNGSAWKYAVELGDPGSGYVGWFTEAPTDGGVWQKCDGSTVNVSRTGGTISSIAVPDLIGKYLKGASAYTGTPGAAVAPGLTGTTGSTSAGTPAGTVSAPTFTGSAAITSTGNASIGNDNGAGQVVQSGTGVTVAAHPHTHTDAGHAHTVTATGTVDAPTFTGSAMSGHTHAAGTLAADATGEPAHLELIPYYRR